MEIKSKVFKRKTGKSKGKWIARVEYFDDQTRTWRTMERQAGLKATAGDLKDKMIDDLEKSHGQIQTGERMTFSDLADICEKEFYRDAVIVEGRRIEGVKSIGSTKSYIKVLRQYFGQERVSELTTEAMSDYRRWRLKNGSRRKEAIESGEFVPVKVATINRELTAMRRMMNYAFAKGWTTKKVFLPKTDLINPAFETKRTRRLTVDEETRLLAACQGEHETEYERTRRKGCSDRPGEKETIKASIKVDVPYLRAIVLLAIDAGMRRGEILKLRWIDIDFAANLIRIVASHTKTEKARLVPLTDRVKSELLRLREFNRGERPFPITDFKGPWATAKRIAGIEDLHFHDLRRTAITRWQDYGLPFAFAGQIAGHSNLQTTQNHYTAADAEIVGKFTTEMNVRHAEAVQVATVSELVN